MTFNPQTCRDCVTASWVLRRLGFRDTISWGTYPETPNTPVVHAFHANSAPIVLEPPVYESQGDGRRVLTQPSRYQRGNTPLPLCTHHRSELAWLSAGRPTRLTVYMAHPVAGDFKKNVVLATQWLQFLRRQTASTLSELTGVAYDRKPLVLAPWLAGIERDEVHPGGRDGAIQDCRDSVLMFDELWMVNRVTEGMKAEAAMARTIRDLTHLGELPPTPLRPTPKKQTARSR